MLLDEHISPTLIAALAEAGVYAQSVPHVGLAGRTDYAIAKYAFNHDFTIVTTNARDFIPLFKVALHPGLIVLRESGLSSNEQWNHIRPVVEAVKRSGDPDFMLNNVIEITGVGQFQVRNVPQP
ncbi:MAG TPA: DUF5615 family PIN-like protein [Candidatus Angelobacter sp.]|nr:DUF5615 family PIN-like protein [Candidatus Angelobacter sp.]